MNPSFEMSRASGLRIPFCGRVVAFLVIALSFGGQGLHATDYLNSSMVAKCLGMDCSQITFTLDVDGKVFVDHVTLNSTDLLWEFGSLIAVVDGEGNDVTANYGGKLTDEGFEITTYSYSPFVYRADPLQLTLEMAGFGTRTQLHGVVGYTAFGDLESDVEPHDAPFNAMGTATVAPEPETWLLMATGMAVLGVVAMRRRRELPLLEEGEQGRAPTRVDEGAG